MENRPVAGRGRGDANRCPKVRRLQLSPEGTADNSQGCQPLENVAMLSNQALKGRHNAPQRRHGLCRPFGAANGFVARIPGVGTPGYYLSPLSGLRE